MYSTMMEDRTAVITHVALLKHRKEWNELVGGMEIISMSANPKRKLIDKIRAIGGTEYLKAQMKVNRTDEIELVFLWWEREIENAKKEIDELDAEIAQELRELRK